MSRPPTPQPPPPRGGRGSKALSPPPSWGRGRGWGPHGHSTEDHYNHRMAGNAPSLLESLDQPPSAAAAVAVLPEPARLWLAFRIGEPTPAQRLAWPALAAGKNLLLCAPTGSGKTLAAFLPFLGALLTGPPVRGVCCLYLAPLKALGNDARKNLCAHIDGIRQFLPEGFGNVRIG